MSSIDVNFKVIVKVGDQAVPLASEVVDSSDSANGVEKGFLFKLDQEPFAAPVTIYLGEMVDFIEKELNAGVGSLASNPSIGFISQAIPSLSANNFKSGDQTILNIYEFSINSTNDQYLFSFNFNVLSSDPSQGVIKLPEEFAQWLKIEDLSISFSAEKSS